MTTPNENERQQRHQRHQQKRQQQQKRQKHRLSILATLLCSAIVLVTLTNCNVVSSFVLQTQTSSTRYSSSYSSYSSYSSTRTRTRSYATTILDSTTTTSNSNDDDNNNEDTDTDTVLPFVVEELSQFKASKVSLEIADLVIKVFFEEEAELKTENRSKGGMTWVNE